MNNNLEKLPLTDDYIFKRVFAYKGNESVLKDFLEALLKIEIKRIKITNPEIIERLEKHHKNFQDAAYRAKNYTKVDAKNIWADIQ